METLQTTNIEIAGYIKGNVYYVARLKKDDTVLMSAQCKNSYDHQSTIVTYDQKSQSVPITLSLESELHHILLGWYNNNEQD